MPQALREILAGPVPAIIVPARILRRVARQTGKVRGIHIPHGDVHTVPRASLLQCVAARELGLAENEIPEGPVVLVARPEAERLRPEYGPAARREIWRARFHGAVHAILEAKIAAGEIDAAAIRRDIDHIGQVTFDEAREVLRHEDRLLPPGGDAVAFVEFAARFLELTIFDRRALPLWFPAAAATGDGVGELLARYLDAAALAEATRVVGASSGLEPGRDPGGKRVRVEWGHERRRLSRGAARAARRGNAVRAAILEMKAGQEADALGRMEALLVRLRAAWPEVSEQPFREGLHELLRRAGAGTRTSAGKALFDLQRGCVEHERSIYAVDVPRFLVSLGRRPVRRELPRLREVLVFRRLRRAAERIERAGLAEGEFGEALRRTVEAAEERLRHAFGPPLRRTLRECGLEQKTLPDRVGLERAVAGLLDRLVSSGRLRIGDLRDAISQNDAKLPAVRNPVQWLIRDPLLIADRRLARDLDGVYRRGEVYLRWLQRISAAALGTRIGSFVVRYAAVPFGGAWVLLSGLHHFVAHFAPSVRLTAPGPVLVLGSFFFALLHSMRFRRGVAKTGQITAKSLRGLFSVPARILRVPAVARFLGSRATKLVFRYGLRPAAGTAAIFAILALIGLSGWPEPMAVTAMFLGVNLFLYSPVFRRAEERTADWLLVNWNFLRRTVLGGLFRTVMAGFRILLDLLDRLLYRMDEWLRFRKGDPRVSVVLKAVANPVWGTVGYVLRFAVTLVVEPQINPIKHFPVVTVSHKVFLPLGPQIATLFAPLGAVAAGVLGGAMTVAIPGLCGFLAWELRENWRLFATNRPPLLGPVMVGHHGESMVRMLRPGLHSGTLPKAWRKLRRAPAGSGKERRHRETLLGVVESVARFVERHAVWLLRERGIEARVGEVRLAGNALRVTLPGLVAISFEEQSGRIVAGVEELTPGAVASGPLRTAVVGLLKRAGVEVVRGQVRAALNGVPWDVSDRGLVVWPDPDYRREVVYALRRGRTLLPREGTGPPLDPATLLFSEWPVSWSDWTRAWDRGAELLPHVPLS
jgi:hypothetical protein